MWSGRPGAVVGALVVARLVFLAAGLRRAERRRPDGRLVLLRRKGVQLRHP